MAKIYGLFGTMTGKLADTVMSVRNGEQIARKYQPMVYNPSTHAQMATRAKMKLMSQLSAVMAPVIAMPRQGNISARNMFVKKNYGAATYDNNQADVELGNIKLTSSVVGISPLVVTRGESNTINLSTNGDAGLDRVVYVAFAKQDDNSLILVESKVVNEKGEANTFPTTMQFYEGYAGAIYAYGMRDNTDATKAKYGNMQTLTAETIAKLVVTRTLTEADVTLTETVSRLLPLPTNANHATAPTVNGDDSSMRSRKK